MKPLQFYRAVVTMRQKQKLYERNHAPSVLREARDWERIIDAEIDRVEELIRQKDLQTKLEFK